MGVVDLSVYKLNLMTRLSVNLNKIALLRNSRGSDHPNVVAFAGKFIDLGVDGITVHPRQDERHTRRSDVRALEQLCASIAGVEFNVEGYPGEEFLDLVEDVDADQCTLVPDDVNQLTSDHGWDIKKSAELLGPVLDRLRKAGIRSSLFIDPVPDQVQAAADIGADRIELYTEEYARSFKSSLQSSVLQKYQEATKIAVQFGIGVNAGHDLNLANLPSFLDIGNILEVSIGHALTVECIERGMEQVIPAYLHICQIESRV